MKKNILIVEDDEFFRELLKKKLLSLSFSVFEATNGEEGVEHAKQKKTGFDNS